MSPSPNPRLVTGGICWLLTAGYFVAELVAAAAWPVPYSFSGDAISELGITTCGELTYFGEGAGFVCSPRYLLMNISFVAAGVLTAAGAVLTRPIWPRRALTTAAVAFIVLSGVGGVLVGLAPADVNLALHGAGALLQVPGAVAPLLIGLTVWRRQQVLAVSSLFCGAVGTIASILFFGQVYLGMGTGTTERLAIWPLTVWTTAVGALVLWSARRRRPAERGTTVTGPGRRQPRR